MPYIKNRKISIPEIELVQYRKSSRKFSLASFVNASIKNEEVSAPDGGYGWVIVFSSFMLNMVVDGITLSVGIFNDSIIKASNGEISNAQMGLVSSLVAGVALLEGPIVAALCNKFGFRPVVIMGAIISSSGIFLSYIISPEVPNIYCLIIFYGIFGGIGFGFIFAPSVVIVGLYFNSKRALATGIAITGTGIGNIIFGPLVEWLISELGGWGPAILAESIIVLSCVIFGALLRPVPNDGWKAKKEEKVEIENTEKKFFLEKIDFKKYKYFILSPTYLVLAISGFITMLGFYVPFIFIADRATEIGKETIYQNYTHQINENETFNSMDFNSNYTTTNLTSIVKVVKYAVSKTEASYIFSAIGVTNTLGRIFFGYLSDRPNVNTLTLSNCALIIGGIGTAFVFLYDDYYALIVYGLLFGASIACYTALRSIIIFQYVGIEKFNDGFGISLLFMGVSSMLGAPIAGLLYDHTKSYDWSFLVPGVLIMISGIICCPLQYIYEWETKRNAKEINGEEEVDVSRRPSTTDI